VHAYCLMPNHYHLVVETPEPNLVAGMAWRQSTYTIRLNHRHKLVGHVFSGRYRSQRVEGWKEVDLKERRRNDPDKLEIAARLRRETTLTIRHIAARVQLGTSKGADRNLHEQMRRNPETAHGQAALAAKRKATKDE
jgi:hypothetical protein